MRALVAALALCSSPRPRGERGRRVEAFAGSARSRRTAACPAFEPDGPMYEHARPRLRRPARPRRATDGRSRGGCARFGATSSCSPHGS